MSVFLSLIFITNSRHHLLYSKRIVLGEAVNISVSMDFRAAR